MTNGVERTPALRPRWQGIIGAGLVIVAVVWLTGAAHSSPTVVDGSEIGALALFGLGVTTWATS